MRDLNGRSIVAERLMLGQDRIEMYMQGVCFDVVAYVRYLLGANITPTLLVDAEGEQWVPHFNFTAGTIWQGGPIPKGTAVGFERQLDMKIFHAALGVGGAKIRGVNNFMLSPGWLHEFNLSRYQPGPQGWFTFDHVAIRAWLSNL